MLTGDHAVVRADPPQAEHTHLNCSLFLFRDPSCPEEIRVARIILLCAFFRLHGREAQTGETLEPRSYSAHLANNS